MKITGQLPYCSMPVAHDTYSGCVARCAYCFSQNLSGAKGERAQGSITPLAPGSFPGADKIPFAVHLGSMHGTLPPVENKTGQTEAFLRQELPRRIVVMSTHQDIAEFPGVLDAIRVKPGSFMLQASTCSDDDDITHAIERGTVPLLRQKLAGLLAVADMGATVVVRMQPFVRAWWKDIPAAIEAFAAHGVRGVIVEHLKIGSGLFNWEGLREACEVAGTPLDELVSAREGFDKTAPLTRKIQNYLRVAKACHERDIACFAADNVLRGLSDTPHCCGVEMMSDYADGKAWTGDLTAVAWRDKTVKAAPDHWDVADDKTERSFIGASGLSQRTQTDVALRRMTISDYMTAYLDDDEKVAALLPFAKKVAPGVWEQTEEWRNLCLATRRPDLVRKLDGVPQEA